MTSLSLQVLQLINPANILQPTHVPVAWYSGQLDYDSPEENSMFNEHEYEMHNELTGFLVP